MSTTLQDGGRRFRDIPKFYEFIFTLYFKQSYLVPKDVTTWCKENCKGYYKVVAYMHKSSIVQVVHYRNQKTGIEETKNVTVHRVSYVDRAYLSDDRDVALLKTHFDVVDQKVIRPEVYEPPARNKKVHNPLAIVASLEKNLKEGDFLRFKTPDAYEFGRMTSIQMAGDLPGIIINALSLKGKGGKKHGNPNRMNASEDQNFRYLSQVEAIWSNDLERWISPVALDKRLNPKN